MGISCIISVCNMSAIRNIIVKLNLNIFYCKVYTWRGMCYFFLCTALDYTSEHLLCLQSNDIKAVPCFKKISTGNLNAESVELLHWSLCHNKFTVTHCSPEKVIIWTQLCPVFTFWAFGVFSKSFSVHEHDLYLKIDYFWLYVYHDESIVHWLSVSINWSINRSNWSHTNTNPHIWR